MRFYESKLQRQLDLLSGVALGSTVALRLLENVVKVTNLEVVKLEFLSSSSASLVP